MPRTLCPLCHFPARVCLCDVVEPFHCRTQIDILQHPSEASSAKNTLRLCQLCMPSLRVWPGETPEDFAAFRKTMVNPETQLLLLYPEADATPLNEWLKRNAPGALSSAVQLVLIDATWRKAHKIRQLNPWLSDLQAVSLQGVEPAYTIRKAPKAHQLSTLEALAHSLICLEPDISVKPLFKVFEARKVAFLCKAPSSQ